MNDEMNVNPSRENETTPPGLPVTPLKVRSRRTISDLPPTEDAPATGLFGSFGRDFAPLDRPLTMLGIADALLKCPAKVAHEVIHGRSLATTGVLLAITVLCLLAYGFIMGTFVGGAQLCLVPLKVAGGLLASALICLPSLHIFTSLTGGQQSLRDTTGLFLQSLALAGILLVGFAPIVWIFSQATSTTVFMGVLHLLFWCVSLGFCLSLLKAAFAHINHSENGILKLWAVIFLVVTLQMSTTLRPLIGKEDGALLKEKKFFVTHWSDCMDHPKP